jgi:hypothetical protein
MSTVHAYAATSATEPLTKTTITRLDVGPHDVRFDIHFAGICHSDIHTVRAEWGQPSYPVVPGHEIAGIVTQAEQIPQTNFESGEPLLWPDGKPRMQWRLTLKVHAGTEEDDGLRNIYAKGGNFEVGEGKGQALLPAILDAYRKAGIKELEGANLTVKRTGRGKKSKGKQAPNLFTAKAEAGKTPVPTPEADDSNDPF